MTSEHTWYVCFFRGRPGKAIVHWHWPKAGAATCTRAYPPKRTTTRRVRVQRTETNYRPGEPQ